jgi:hypothetical protein
MPDAALATARATRVPGRPDWRIWLSIMANQPSGHPRAESALGVAPLEGESELGS